MSVTKEYLAELQAQLKRKDDCIAELREIILEYAEGYRGLPSGLADAIIAKYSTSSKLDEPDITPAVNSAASLASELDKVAPVCETCGGNEVVYPDDNFPDDFELCPDCKPLGEIAQDIMADVPESEWAKLPADLSQESE